MNANFTDVASMLTASVASDGQTPMTAPLRHADGSEALPGLSFDDDTNTGIRRSGADVLELVTGGADRVQIDAAGKVWALGAFDVAGVANFQGVVTLINTGLHLLDTDASHDLIIKPGSDLAADRTLTLVTGDADRTLTLQGDVTLPAGTALVVANNLSDVADAPTAFAAIKQAATDSATGVVEIAVQSEMETATDTGRAVVPGRQHFHPGHPKAWGRFAANGTLVSGDYNVASVVRDNAGIYTVTLTNAMADTNYAVLVTSPDDGSNAWGLPTVQISSASVFVIRTRNLGGTPADGGGAHFAVFGDMS